MPVAAVGLITSGAEAESILESGDIDAIFVGADPAEEGRQCGASGGVGPPEADSIQRTSQEKHEGPACRPALRVSVGMTGFEPATP